MKFKYYKKLKRPSYLRYILAAVSGFLLLVLIAVFLYKIQISPINKNNTEPVRVVVEPGQSTDQILDNLVEAGLVRGGIFTEIFTKLNSDISSFQSGSYDLQTSMSLKEIFVSLSTGRVVTRSVLILPGSSLQEISTQLRDHGFADEQVKAALNIENYKSHALIRLDKFTDLEGLIYPDTYVINAGSHPSEIIGAALDRFYLEVSDNLLQKLKNQKLSFKQGVILASIIEKESGGLADEQKIAQVFLKRIKIDMQLGSDVTFIYAAKKDGKQPSVDYDSPYNTRRYSGLPPGAISNFTIDALKAVANPAKTDYLYFVAGDDGVTRFSKTLEEHERITAETCIKNCAL